MHPIPGFYHFGLNAFLHAPFCVCSCAAAAGCCALQPPNKPKTQNKMHIILPHGDALGLLRSCGATTSARIKALQNEEGVCLPHALQRGQAVLSGLLPPAVAGARIMLFARADEKADRALSASCLVF